VKIAKLKIATVKRAAVRWPTACGLRSRTAQNTTRWFAAVCTGDLTGSVPAQGAKLVNVHLPL
jgi:hypothetical protein